MLHTCESAGEGAAEHVSRICCLLGSSTFHLKSWSEASKLATFILSFSVFQISLHCQGAPGLLVSMCFCGTLTMADDSLWTCHFHSQTLFGVEPWCPCLSSYSTAIMVWILVRVSCEAMKLLSRCWWEGRCPESFVFRCESPVRWLGIESSSSSLWSVSCLLQGDNSISLPQRDSCPLLGTSGKVLIF